MGTRFSCLALGAVLVLSETAFAQTGNEAEAGEAEAESASEDEGASEAPEAPPADGPEIEEARERLARGETLFDAGDYDAALVEFERAYELLEGHPARPLVLFNVGKSYEKLFRYDQAMEYYRRYLEETGEDAEDRAQVRAKIELLEGLLATIEIETNVSEYEVWVDENKVGDSMASVLVPGGSHVVELRAPGHQPARQQVQIPARAERELTFELERLAEEYHGVSPLYFWGSVGLSAVALGVGAVFGGLALGKKGDVDSQLDDPVERWRVGKKDRKDIQDLTLRADIFFGVGGLFAAGALVLAFLTDWGGEATAEEAVPGESARLKLRPAIAPDTAGLLVEGAF